MRVQITHPIDNPVLLQAGQVVDVASTLAKIWIENDWAFEIKEETMKDEPTTDAPPPKPKYKREVTHGDG
jgi:hypothetical protein